MKNTFLTLTLFLVFGAVQSQNILTKEKMLADYDAFREIFEQANAGVYRYHTKQETDSLFNANRKLISAKTTYRDFYNIVWDVVDFTGSSHNSLVFPDSLDKALSTNNIFFPIPLKYLQGKLYAIASEGNIPLGSEIISVNGISAQEFSKDISRYVSTDGFNKTGKFAFIETDWLPFYIYLAYGERNEFNVVYKKGKGLNTVVLPSVDYRTSVINYKKRFVPKSETLEQPDYSFTYLSDNAALLTVNTFGLGGPSTEGHNKYKVFLDSVFTDLKNRKTENIIVDIRKNGGGNDPNDLLLYSYLTKRNFRENTSAYTLFNTVPLKQYFVEEETDEIKELEEKLKEEHSVFKDGKFYQNEQFNKVWEPNPYAFHGKIYLLTSPFVASAGSLFAAMVKSDEGSTVIGQETLGGYYGHTGHIPVTYKLPNSGLMLTFSIVDLDQDVQILSDQQKGQGIMPDYNVEPGIEDYLNDNDVVLEFIRKML